MNGPQIATAACCPIRGVAVGFFSSVCRFALVALSPRQNNINNNGNEIKFIIDLLTFGWWGNLCKYNDAVEIQNRVTRRKCFQPQLPSPLCLSVPPSVCVASVRVARRPAGSADRSDQDSGLAGGGEAAAALRPVRLPPTARRHRGRVRQGPRQTHREVHPQDQEVSVCRIHFSYIRLDSSVQSKHVDEESRPGGFCGFEWLNVSMCSL